MCAHIGGEKPDEYAHNNARQKAFPFLRVIGNKYV